MTENYAKGRRWILLSVSQMTFQQLALFTKITLHETNSAVQHPQGVCKPYINFTSSYSEGERNRTNGLFQCVVWANPGLKRIHPDTQYFVFNIQLSFHSVLLYNMHSWAPSWSWSCNEMCGCYSQNVKQSLSLKLHKDFCETSFSSLYLSVLIFPSGIPCFFSVQVVVPNDFFPGKPNLQNKGWMKNCVFCIIRKAYHWISNTSWLQELDGRHLKCSRKFRDLLEKKCKLRQSFKDIYNTFCTSVADFVE